MTEVAENPTAVVAPPSDVDRLRADFADEIVEVIEALGETTVVLRRDRIIDVLRRLRDDYDLAYGHCSDVTVVDYLNLDLEPRFAVVYHLYSLQRNRRLRLRAQVPEADPTIASCVGLYPTANWLEREAFDMFGVVFNGHPDLKRILMPDEWEGPPPLRKDSPVGGEDIEFTYNVGKVHGRRSEI